VVRPPRAAALREQENASSKTPDQVTV